MKLDSKKEKKRLKKWLDAKWYLESAISRTENALAKPFSTDMIGGLECLESWYGNLGNYLVLNLDKQGWVEVRRCFEYQSACTRIKAVYEDLATRGASYSGDTASPLCFSLAFRQDLFARWLGNRVLREVLSGKCRLSPPAALNYAYLQFYALLQERTFNIRDFTNQSLDVYQDILDNWADERSYVKACLAACDYHVERIDEEEGFSEFDGAPQDLLPIEMLMIRRIREDHGLPNPEIDHPLMQTPLGKAPRTLPEVKDELLERVLAKARKELTHFPEF